MKKFKIFVVSIASASAAFAADIDIKPGELEGLLNSSVIADQSLGLSGSIDARDFAAMEKLPGTVTELNLSGVSIEKLTLSTTKYFGRTLFAENELPCYSFFKSGLQSIILPATVKGIGDGAFTASAITRIEIPEGVESIGDYAFYDCKNLTTVVLPSSLKKIGKGAFANCVSLKEISLSATGLEEIPEKAFAGCVELQTVGISPTIKKIGREAFTHTRIKELNLNRITDFEPYALSGMPYLEDLTLNPKANMANGLLMDNTSLSSLSGVPGYLPDYFAANCSELNTQSMMNYIVRAGQYSLANHSPEKLYLGGSLSKIERGALSGNKNLTEIDAIALGDLLPEVDETSFEGINPPDIKLIVTDDSEPLWRADPEWSRFNIYASSTTTVIETATPEGTGITIRQQGGNVTVESVSPLTGVSVYSTDGRLLMSATPQSSTFEISTSDLNPGIVIIKAINADKQTETISIMLK